MTRIVEAYPELKGKRLAVFGANNVTEEVTAFARRYGIVFSEVE